VATDVSSAPSEATPRAPITADMPAHRLRFSIIYGALGAVLVLAIVGVVVFANRSIHPTAAWSSWHPKGGGLGAAKDIAQHVSATYRLPDGDQLVDVITMAPSITPTTSTLPIHYVALKGQVYPVSSTNSVQYSMCGLGASCQIASGTPSVERGRLVRREILELSLYTFKYASGIQSVIAFMPPSPGKTTKYVVFLRRTDLAADLKQPLATTLAQKVPLPKAIPAREVHVIDSATVPRLYSLGVAQAQQGDLVFVLTPIPA
jgi:hypothetical protein